MIIDRFIKSDYFLPIKIIESIEKLAEMYVREIIKLHGVPISIVSDREARFTSKFRKRLHEKMGTKLNFSTTHHL